jgi:hypothetical protein
MSNCSPVSVAPLPSGSGGGNNTKQQLNDTNVQLSMLQADACASSKFDSPVPQPVKQAQLVQHFCSQTQDTTRYSVTSSVMVVGALLIVYGLIAK